MSDNIYVINEHNIESDGYFIFNVLYEADKYVKYVQPTAMYYTIIDNRVCFFTPSSKSFDEPFCIRIDGKVFSSCFTNTYNALKLFYYSYPKSDCKMSYDCIPELPSSLPLVLNAGERYWFNGDEITVLECKNGTVSYYFNDFPLLDEEMEVDSFYKRLDDKRNLIHIDPAIFYSDMFYCISNILDNNAVVQEYADKGEIELLYFICCNMESLISESGDSLALFIQWYNNDINFRGFMNEDLSHFLLDGVLCPSNAYLFGESYRKNLHVTHKVLCDEQDVLINDDFEL